MTARIFIVTVKDRCCCSPKMTSNVLTTDESNWTKVSYASWRSTQRVLQRSRILVLWDSSWSRLITFSKHLCRLGEWLKMFAQSVIVPAMLRTNGKLHAFTITRLRTSELQYAYKALGFFWEIKPCTPIASATASWRMTLYHHVHCASCLLQI